MYEAFEKVWFLVRFYHVFMSFDRLKVFSDFNLTQSIGKKAFFLAPAQGFSLLPSKDWVLT